ncbi:molecular chaperone [Orbus wheelerorum]|uniref:fimbrial biogenesis chaperone n=1 Tax=Orbus wheelerorum TaxID=3074111 RepID=UPI00370D66F4
MFRKILSVFLFLTIGLSHVYAEPSAGITLGSTRMIYNASVSQTAIGIMNSDNRAYLIQSWVSKTPESKSKEDRLFITTPPLFRLEPDSKNSVRVMYIGNSLPQDRESVFWLNIKSIPSTEKTNNNTLVIAIKSQIKLFYRPTDLPGDPALAYKQIKFLVKNDKLVIDNPTAFSVSFNEIKINGILLQDAVMVLPFSTQTINKNVALGQTVTWTVINDYGGITPVETTRIIK